MSILTRPIGKPKSKPATTEVVAIEQDAPLATAPAKGKPGAAPALALSPRASLLPPEIFENRHKRVIRRNLRLATLGVFVVVALAVGGAFYLAFSAQAAVQSARAEVESLNVQLAKFSEISATRSLIATGTSAVKVGGSSDIDWSDYISKLQGTLPAGVTITKLTTESQGITEPYAQTEGPLSSSSVGTLTFSASSDAAPVIPDWIDALSTLPGFADATPTNFARDDATGKYTVDIVMHINSDAFSYEFAPKPKGDDK